VTKQHFLSKANTDLIEQALLTLGLGQLNLAEQDTKEFNFASYKVRQEFARQVFLKYRYLSEFNQNSPTLRVICKELPEVA